MRFFAGILIALTMLSACAHKEECPAPPDMKCPDFVQPDVEAYCKEYTDKYKMQTITLLDECKADLAKAKAAPAPAAKKKHKK